MPRFDDRRSLTPQGQLQGAPPPRTEAQVRNERAAATPRLDDDGEPICNNPAGHEWAYTGTAYGGDDESYHGEGRVYCVHCGTDGDA